MPTVVVVLVISLGAHGVLERTDLSVRTKRTGSVSSTYRAQIPTAVRCSRPSL